MDKKLSKIQESGRPSHSGNTEVERKASRWPYETVRAFSGNYVTRLRSSIFYWGSLLSFISGIVLLTNEHMAGGFLVLTSAPFLLLYPLIRLLFGGKDSVGVVLTTAVAEEIVKGKIFRALEKSSKKNKR